MKTTEHPDHLEINSGSGTVSVVLGAVFFVVGIVFFVVAQGNSEIPFIVSLIPLVFSALGVLAVFTAKNRVAKLRADGESEISTTRVITRKQTSVTFESEDVESVNIFTDVKWSNSGSSSQGTSKRKANTISSISLSVKGEGEEVKLGQVSRPGARNGHPGLSSAKRVASYLGAELVDLGSPNMSIDLSNFGFGGGRFDHDDDNGTRRRR